MNMNQEQNIYDSMLPPLPDVIGKVAASLSEPTSQNIATSDVEDALNEAHHHARILVRTNAGHMDELQKCHDIIKRLGHALKWYAGALPEDFARDNGQAARIALGIEKQPD